MSWRKNVGDLFADALRLIARAGVLITLIISSAFVVWFTWRSAWALGAFCNRTLFGG